MKTKKYVIRFYQNVFKFIDFNKNIRTDVQNVHVHHKTNIQQNIEFKIELRHGDKRETKTTKQHSCQTSVSYF